MKLLVKFDNDWKTFVNKITGKISNLVVNRCEMRCGVYLKTEFQNVIYKLFIRLSVNYLVCDIFLRYIFIMFSLICSACYTFCVNKSYNSYIIKLISNNYFYIVY